MRVREPCTGIFGEEEAEPETTGHGNPVLAPRASASLIGTEAEVLLSRATEAAPVGSTVAAGTVGILPQALGAHHEPLLAPRTLSPTGTGGTSRVHTRSRAPLRTGVKDKGPPAWGRTPRGGPRAVSWGPAGSSLPGTPLPDALCPPPAPPPLTPSHPAGACRGHLPSKRLHQNPGPGASLRQLWTPNAETVRHS